ncbi:uncharacterized protein LOC122195599 [Lactuca sativa]|uniref:uncharacterized protein LOC122195599 n=1 Tax=Lactuca sativa TaxID=4236 RepID=UPI000CB87158|nr:uncharacterized protein LOC122195599 [Lactuca sativa]
MGGSSYVAVCGAALLWMVLAQSEVQEVCDMMKQALTSAVLSYRNRLYKSGEQEKMWSSSTEKNPCRRFIRCPSSLDPSKDCDFLVWMDEDLPFQWYKNKVVELHKENIDLYKDNMILSKENRELEMENKDMQKKLMNLELLEKKKRTDLFKVKVMLLSILLIFIFIWFLMV